MADIHEIIGFSVEGEKILGVVIEHYTNPLDDFYVVYADYTLFKSHSSNEDATVIIDNVIIPACDAALTDYRLKRQHLKDINRAMKNAQSFIDAINSKMETEGLFSEDNLV